jgi:hypothetical protein
MQAFQSDRQSAAVPNALSSSDGQLGDSLSAGIAALQELINGMDNDNTAKIKDGFSKLDDAMLSMAKAEAALAVGAERFSFVQRIRDREAWPGRRMRLLAIRLPSRRLPKRCHARTAASWNTSSASERSWSIAKASRVADRSACSSSCSNALSSPPLARATSTSSVGSAIRASICALIHPLLPAGNNRGCQGRFGEETAAATGVATARDSGVSRSRRELDLAGERLGTRREPGGTHREVAASHQVGDRGAVLSISLCYRHLGDWVRL